MSRHNHLLGSWTSLIAEIGPYTLLYAVLLLLAILSGFAFSVILLGFALRSQNENKRAALLLDLGCDAPWNSQLFVGFFHPYCNAGGGGERVLWTAVAHLQSSRDNTICAIYTGDVDASKDEIISKVKARFAITLRPETLHFVFLRSRYLIEDDTWRRFTLLGQSVGSMILAVEALSQLIPDIYFDSMGYAFTFHVARMLTPSGTPIGAYVHYPTISTDMLNRVRTRQAGHTNSGSVARSNILSLAKLRYYQAFAWLYALSLSRASYIMVNSSWTKNHVDALLASRLSRSSKNTKSQIIDASDGAVASKEASDTARSQIVYPPCDTRSLTTFSLEARQRIIISLAQFRPEKEHSVQLQALSHLLEMKPEYRTGSEGIQLVLLGSSRNDEDAKRVEALQSQAKALGIEENVQFVVNASYEELLVWLSRASIGLSTMKHEHFGINIVEFMAAGLIPVVHASGGPLQDIVVQYNGQSTGFHAEGPESFASKLDAALSLNPSAALAMRKRARALAVEKFSEEEFIKGWDVGWKELIRMRRRP